MPIPEIRTKVQEMIKNEQDLEKIKPLKELDDSLAAEELSEEKLLKQHGELMDAYKKSIMSEGSEKEPSDPAASSTPTIESILAEITKAKA